MVSCPAALLPAPHLSSLDPDRVLVDRFGLAAFHAWQREAIDALLEGSGQVLLVAPTGGGKSLCYQLPSVVLDGTAVVISPLIALMEDQVGALGARGIPSTFLASTLDSDERRRRLHAMRSGAFKIVYVAPERLALEGFSELMGDIRLSLLAVDEAHCIVQWGHDFRPDYLRIGALIDRLRPRRVIACTATATPASQREILQRLKFDSSRTKVILRGFARPNLELSVLEVEGAKGALAGAEDALERALGGPRGSRSAARATGIGGGAIVYAATRRTSENISRQLEGRGWKARAYHAGLPAAERSSVQKAFADRSLPVVVATNAFGMGIDRADVRAVVHAQPPASIENYYQEVGRAGRDGAPAIGLLMLAPGDVPLRRRMCELGSDGGPALPEQAERSWGLFRELLRYIDASTCRHDFILRYFGDEAESLGGCGHCDVCRDIDRALEVDPATLAKESTTIRQALAGVARARGRGGMQAVAEMLHGKPTERVVRFGFDGLSTFGLLAAQNHDDIMRLLRALIGAGFIDLSPGEYPIPVLTALGARVMRSEEPLRMRIPRAPGARPERAARGAGGGKPRRRSGRRSAETEPATADATLFEALRVHRAVTAGEAGVPAYVVAHDSTLLDLASRRPATAKELEEIRGMGAVKIARYGEGFLGIVRRFTTA
jgi:ATP-dependent DNA helicase RecQ